MPTLFRRSTGLAALGLALIATSPWLAGIAQPRRNVIVFVADGLRHGSITEQDTPTLWSVRTNGVHFEDSHSMFPTYTTANASAIATGHGLGDTGDYSNVIWPGFATFDTGAFNLPPGTPVPFIENDRVLADLAGHFGGNYLGEDTLFTIARAQGYRTAAVGKIGPTAIQDIEAIAPVNDGFPPFGPGIVIDDASGSSVGPAIPPTLVERLRREGLATEAPTRSNGYGATSQFNNGYVGDRTHAGTLAANAVQQQWLVEATTRAILPMLTESGAAPFVLLYWSRDPDGAQHNHGDSLGALAPGINGPTAHKGVQNADRNLQQILAWLDAHPAIKANTDVFVTSDHGFATISRRELDRTGRPSEAESAKHDYVDGTGKIDTVKGVLPFGFLAIDLATSLKTNLFDPDQRAEGSRVYKRMAIDTGAATWEHPILGNGLIGGDVLKPEGTDARVIVAAGGGSDLIYVPGSDSATIKRVVELLLSYDYVSGVFVDDGAGAIPGTLPLSAINLVGASKLPRPTIAVAFKVFYLNSADLQTAIQISDTVLQEGQGMHGGFGRDSTYNNMAAIGPDFKSRFTDPLPMGNGDIVPTLAKVMGLSLKPNGRLVGRVLTESLAETAAPGSAAPLQYLRSTAVNGKQTVLIYREQNGVRYLDASCMVAPSTADGPNMCR
jgi:hypothetical protein